jgi:PAS domain-containing protein
MDQPNLVLILARELADKLATPMFVVDADGRLAYFNERAGELLGESFAVTGRAELHEWASRYQPTSFDGRPLAAEELPLVVALSNREPAHLEFRVEGLDGVRRDIAATAFPLFARTDEFVGAAAIFWEQRADADAAGDAGDEGDPDGPPGEPEP